MKNTKKYGRHGMLRSIAEFQIIEKINNQDMTTSVSIFDKADKIKIIRKADGSKMTAFEGTADEFLRKIQWAHQFLDSNKIKSLKNWRK